MAEKRNIGHGIERESTQRGDKHDPFAGGFGVRGSMLVGTVTSAKANKTVTVQLSRKILVPKYNRYMSRTYKIHAHNPESIDAKQGDVVRIAETRPISKTKHHCVVEIIKSEEQ